MRRKPREAPPPAKYVRSVGGVPARVKKTSKTTDDGRWLYRLDYGNVVGTQLWTLSELEASGVKWLKIKPRDLEV